MADMIANELGQAWNDFGHALAHLFPRLLAILIIAAVGWLIAYLLKVVLRSVLRLAKFDRLSERAGAAKLLNSAALPTPSELLCQLVFWLAWVGILLAGISFLGIAGLQQHIEGFFLFLPRFFVALFMIFLGMLAADFFARAALLAAVNSNMPSPQLLSAAVKALIVVLAVSMAFEEIGLVQRTILIAFTVVFGALMLGLAIAFGLGGRDLARQFLEKRFSDQRTKKPEENDLSPL
jgi:Mechanosensitive ion channel, conserved TM helix